jgi:hypothetical protein
VDAWCFRRYADSQCIDADWDQIGHFKVLQPRCPGLAVPPALPCPARHLHQGFNTTLLASPQYHLKACIQAAVNKGFRDIYVLPHNDIKGAPKPLLCSAPGPVLAQNTHGSARPRLASSLRALLSGPPALSCYLLSWCGETDCRGQRMAAP